MTVSNALLKTPRILSLTEPDGELLSCSVLHWRRQLLLVTAVDDRDSHNCTQAIPALQNLQWLEACLKLSAIKAVRLSINLGEVSIKHWANVGARTGKQIFLQLPTAAYLPKSRSPFAWGCKRVADWITAAALLIILSPLLLLLVVTVWLDSSGSIFFKQWRVGHRGQLFEILKFRTMHSNAEQSHHQLMVGQTGMHKLQNDPRMTNSGRWLRKYSLDELPQLFNVLRGEMSLVGPRPLALYDAIRLGSIGRKRLNALPGMTGFWQVQMRSHQRDLEAVSQIDFDYLKNWSLLKDFRLILLTLPKVLSGFGAF